MKILFAASEFHPLIKTGGLGDVTGSLTQSLAEDAVHQVYMLLPGYAPVLESLDDRELVLTLTTPVDEREAKVTYSKKFFPVRFLVLEHPTFEHLRHPYEGGDVSNERNDNFIPFVILSYVAARLSHSPPIDVVNSTKDETIKAKMYLFRELGLGQMDWVVSNDWHTGLIPAYLKQFIRNATHETQSIVKREIQKPAKVAHIIHNLAFPGIYSYDDFSRLGLDNDFFSSEGLEYYGKLSFQKSALFYSDLIFTVSPSYREELLNSPEMAMGFHGILQHRKDVFHGILNGIDTEVWDPAQTPYPYTANPTGIVSKWVNKHDFLKRHFTKLKLTSKPPKKPKLLVGVVSRLTGQKGMDLVADYLETWGKKTKTKFNFVILGTGDHSLEERFTKLSQGHDHIVYYNVFNEPLSRELITAADVFLIPSRFEPCGLTQMYAMRMGTLPIVNPVGGLKDTVMPWEKCEAATGFYLPELSAEGLAKTLTQVISLFQDTSNWINVMINAMNIDFSWKKSRQEYLDKLIAIR